MIPRVGNCLLFLLRWALLKPYWPSVHACLFGWLFACSVVCFFSDLLTSFCVLFVVCLAISLKFILVLFCASSILLLWLLPSFFLSFFLVLFVCLLLPLVLLRLFLLVTCRWWCCSSSYYPPSSSSCCILVVLWFVACFLPLAFFLPVVSLLSLDVPVAELRTRGCLGINLDEIRSSYQTRIDCRINKNW